MRWARRASRPATCAEDIKERNTAQQRSSGGVPFAYTAPAHTALNQVTYYDHDHLGNTRLTYTPTRCQDLAPTDGVPEWALNIEHAVDYDPYGSILREFVNGQPEKYLTTHHERDQETGLDYRGARYYDSDVGRFLALDPKAVVYPSWSPYNYVMGNPVSLVDPDGKSARCGCPNPPCQTDDPREEIVKKIDKAKPSADKASKAAYGALKVDVSGGLSLGYKAVVKMGPTQLGVQNTVVGTQTTMSYKTNSDGSFTPHKVSASYAVGQSKAQFALPGVANGSLYSALMAGSGAYDGRQTTSTTQVLAVGADANLEPSITRDGVTASASTDGTVGVGLGVGFAEVDVQLAIDQFATWVIESFNALGALLTPSIPKPGPQQR